MIEEFAKFSNSPQHQPLYTNTMTTQIAEFIEKLDNLMDKLKEIDYPKEDDSGFLHDLSDDHVEIKSLIEDIISDADGLLIIGSGRYAGQADFERHRLLKTLSKNKYYVTKGESDSFGWLSGKINTPHGIIVYG